MKPYHPPVPLQLHLSTIGYSTQLPAKFLLDQRHGRLPNDPKTIAKVTQLRHVGHPLSVPTKWRTAAGQSPVKENVLISYLLTHLSYQKTRNSCRISWRKQNQRLLLRLLADI